MNSLPQDHPPISEITLPERLDYAACEGLFEMFQSVRGHPVRVSADRVTFLGALAAEILLRAATQWRLAGLGFDIFQPSQGFSQGLAMLGLSDTDLAAGGAT